MVGISVSFDSASLESSGRVADGSNELSAARNHCEIWPRQECTSVASSQMGLGKRR